MIAIIDYQLSETDCYGLIGMGTKNMSSAKTLGTQIDGYRTAQNSWIKERNELTQKLKSIVAAKSSHPIENQELIHIVKYDVGGEYKPHHDFFPPTEDYTASATANAGQRVISCLFYLNDDFEGGETEFPTKKIKVTPKTGRMLMWSNMYPNGELDYESLHAGLPVISGTKWVAIVWVREKTFDCGCGNK
jgi:prolyl 4-hydroxylase